MVSTKIYTKRDDFNFDIVNFPFLDGDVPRRSSYGVNISQLICFAIASSHVTESNRKAMNRNWGNKKVKPALKTKAGNK